MSAIQLYMKELLNGVDMDEAAKQDLYEELTNHLTLSKINYMKQGMSEEEAEQTCIKEFGPSKIVGRKLQKSMFPKKSVIKKLSWFLFVIYILTILLKTLADGISIYPDGSWVTARFDRYHMIFTNSLPSVNLIPFYTIFNYLIHWQNYNLSIPGSFLIGNIILFLPMGIFLPILFPSFRNYKRILASTFIISFGIECIQLITVSGVADVDAILLRMVGSIIGLFLYRTVPVAYLNAAKKAKLLLT